jgi:hypothetical protein
MNEPSILDADELKLKYQKHKVIIMSSWFTCSLWLIESTCNKSVDWLPYYCLHWILVFFTLCFWRLATHRAFSRYTCMHQGHTWIYTKYVLCFWDALQLGQVQEFFLTGTRNSTSRHRTTSTLNSCF